MGIVTTGAGAGTAREEAGGEAVGEAGEDAGGKRIA